MSPIVRILSAALFLSAPAFAAEGEAPWMTPGAVEGIPWGSSNQPIDAVPRPRDYYLPDAGYIGRSSTDRPDDLELSAGVPAGERRFLRYVNGQLVDAWQARSGPLATHDFEIAGEEAWVGPVLGPADDGYRSFGIGRSWTLGDRTVLHWTDRTSDLQILASRATPTGAYGVVRAAPLVPGGAGRAKARIKGPLKDWVMPAADYLSGCLENAPKPVEAEVWLQYDAKGQPGKIRATTDQPAPSMIECFASAVVKTSAPPNTKGSFTVLRIR